MTAAETSPASAEALSRMDAAFAAAGPVFALAPGRAGLVYANAAARARFGAADDAGLAARLLQGEEPGARRIRQLAGAFSLHAPPRREQLRFFTGGRLDALTLAAHSLTLSGAPVLVLAPPDLDPARLLAGVAEEAAPAAETPAAETPADAPVETHVDAVVAFAAQPVETAATPADAPGIPPAPARAPRPRVTAPQRFVWASDAAGRFVSVGPALEAAVGAPGALAGRSLAEIADSLGGEAGAALLAGFGRAGAWSAPRLPWPIEGEAGRAVVDLSGAPVFDRARRVVGYRGFGLVRPERLPAPEAPLAPEAPPDIQAPPTICCSTMRGLRARPTS